MGDDWDLFAVVRSCTSSATSSAAISTNSPSTSTNVTAAEDALACLAALVFEEENDPFHFPNLFEPTTSGFNELHQLFKPFFPNPTTSTSAIPPIAAVAATQSTPTSDFGAPTSSKNVQQRQHHLQPIITPNMRHHFNSEISSSTFGSFKINQQEIKQPLQEQQQQPIKQPQTPTARKRKSQQQRTVCHVSAENLSTDMWAWRKYGQKPIKGSPYPRNYYRCSSSKGCAARKQVERTSNDPNIFVITYTGDHTHPLPTHRNSLAGSTRNKIPTTQKPASADSGSPSAATAICSSPSLSPTTPLTVQNEEDAAKEISNGDEMEMEDSEEDEEDILIPNMTMTEDIFMGLQELGFTPASADNIPGKRHTELKPHWTLGNSASTGATSSGGC